MVENYKNVNNIINKLNQLKSARVELDAQMERMEYLLTGQFDRIPDAADAFSQEGFARKDPVIGNTIAVLADDFARQVGKTPTVSCDLFGENVDDAAKKRASTRTKVLETYISNSNLPTMLQNMAHHYNDFGFAVMVNTFDVENNLPSFDYLNPREVYYSKGTNRKVDCVYVCKEMKVKDLVNMYPDFEFEIKGLAAADTKSLKYGSTANPREKLEVTIVYTKESTLVIVYNSINAGSTPLCVSEWINPIGKMLVDVAERPGLTDEPRGQFNDVVGAWLAKNRLALNNLEAVQKTLDPTKVLPTDAAHAPQLGNVITTDNPGGVNVLNTSGPTQAGLYQLQALEQEINNGSSYPVSRTGQSDASVVTGQGVKQLQAGFSSLVNSAQLQFARLLKSRFSIALELDRVVFGGVQKKVSGTVNGGLVPLTYDPAKIIKEDEYGVEVSYGIELGLDISQQAVFIVQMYQYGLISKERARSELPFDLNPQEEQRKTAVEKMDDSVLLGIQGIAQQIGALITQGQAELALQLTQTIIRTKQLIEKDGMETTDAWTKAQTEIAQQQAQAQAEAEQAATAQGSITGQPEGVPFGQQGQAPGTRPTLASLASRLTTSGDAPQLSSTVQSRTAV